MFKKKVYVSGKGFGAFIFGYLLHAHFSDKIESFYQDSKLCIFPSGISDLTIQQLTRILGNDSKCFLEKISMSNTLQKIDTKYTAYILSENKINSIYSLFLNLKSDLKIKPDFSVVASNYEIELEKNIFLNIFTHVAISEKESLGNFESIYGKYSCNGYQIDGKYYLMWSSEDDSKKGQELFFTSQGYNQNNFKEVKIYKNINALNFAQDNLYIASGKGFTPISLGFSNQLAILDSIYTILYLFTANKKYIQILNKIRLKVHLEVDIYFKNLHSFNYEAYKTVSSVDIILEKSVTLYLKFLEDYKK